jgi:hypothetical protein
MKKVFSFVLSLLTIFVLTLSLMAPIGTVLAEGEAPADPTAEAPVIETPAVDPTPEATPENTPVVDETPQEVIEALPENTDLVVLDEQGEVLPLVTEEAAETIIEGDPMWCPENQNPANDMDDLVQDCTDSFTNFTGNAGLLKELQNNPSLYSGNGTIYVATGNISAFDQNKTITINGNNLAALSGSTLGIQGGWKFDGASSGIDYDNPSYFASSGLSIINWGGNVWVDNIVTDSAPANGLNVNTAGSMSVTNSEFYNSIGFGADINSGFVSSSENDEAPAVYLENIIADGNEKGGARINASDGHVAVNNSEFSNNGYNEAEQDYAGLTVNLGTDEDSASGKQITLEDVYAYGNSGHGTILRNHQGATTIDNSWFEENGVAGLRVENDWGDVWLDGVTSLGNSANGIRIEAYNPNVPGVYGYVNVLNSSASGNASGLYIGNAGSVYINNSIFNENRNDGTRMEYVNAWVTIINSIFNFNDDHGARLDDIGDLFVSGSDFSYNYGFARDSGGLYANTFGSASIQDSFFDGNGANEYCFWDGETEYCFPAFAPAYGLAIQTGGSGREGPVGLQSILPEESSYSTAITLVNVEANNNGAMGAGLISNGGNINITDSTFDFNGVICWLYEDCSFENYIHNTDIYQRMDGLNATSFGTFGPFALTTTVEPETSGNITLVNTTSNGNAEFGAYLSTLGGDALVKNGQFNDNGFLGLLVEAFGIEAPVVTLDHVTANGNGVIGAVVFAPSMSGPTLLTEGSIETGTPQSKVVVNCGTFSNNGFVGLEVIADILELNGPVLDGNGEEPYFFYGSTLFLGDCSAPTEEPPVKPVKPINEVEVGTGGSSALMCEKYSGTLLILENGDKVYLPCFIQDTGSLFTTHVDKLPGELPGGKDNYASALELTLTKEGSEVNLIENGVATVFFNIPEELKDKNPVFGIMYWDETANNGKGAWVELPARATDENGKNISFPLHDPSDGKFTMVGVYSEDGYVKVEVNYTGTFALVIK